MEIEKRSQQILSKRLNALTGHKKLEAAAGGAVEPAPGAQVVYMLIDCSGSMEGEKLTAAKLGAIKFAKQAQQQSHSIGLVSFASEAFLRAEPARALEKLEREINVLSVNGSTNLTAGIELTFKLLKTIRGERVIYVITDGMPDDASSALNVADQAKRAGIRIITLGTDDANQDFLAQLASRPEMSKKVDRTALQEGIASMVKLLGN